MNKNILITLCAVLTLAISAQAMKPVTRTVQPQTVKSTKVQPRAVASNNTQKTAVKSQTAAKPNTTQRRASFF